MAKGVWGIDVSKYSAKAVRLEGAGDSPTLTHVGVFAYEGAGTGEPGDPDAQIKQALTQIKSTYKITSEPIVFSLPSHSTFNRLIKLPPVDDAKIPEIVKYEAQSQIPFNIDEVLWDYQYVERAYSPGEEKEVILFAIKKDIVEQFLENIADLRFNVEAIQFAPVALFNFLVRDQEMSGATVALDMGGDNTDLIVIDGTKFWVRNLPITGNDITKALQKAFNIPFDEAEKLKLKAGQSQQAQKIFNAIQPVLRDLVNEINRSMGYYKSISKTSKFDKILLLGNSTKTLNFQKFVSQSLQLNAARVQKLNTMSVGGQVDPGDLGESLATIGTALGLALQGISQTTNRVNLLPPVFVKAKELKKKQPFLVAAMAALFVLVGLAYVKDNGAVNTLQASATLANSTKKIADAQIEAFKEAKKVEDVRDNLEPLTQLSSERDLVLKIMDLVNPNIPDNGKWETPPAQKLWVVDWEFEEKERIKLGDASAANPQAASMAPATGRPYPINRILTAVIQVVITKRNSDPEGRDFIVRQLLNYNQGAKQPARGESPCPIKNPYWELPDGGWAVIRDADDLVWPIPNPFPGGKGDDQPTTDKKNYWRYQVKLELPVGEENRKAQASEKGAEKK